MAKPKGIKRDILIRVRWLYVLFIVMGLGIVAKIGYTQYGPGSRELRERAAEVIYSREVTPAMRGDILARDGQVLATTMPLFDVRVDFAAAVIDSTFKEMARDEIRAAARDERAKEPGNRRFVRAVDEVMRARLRDHGALDARAAQIRGEQCDSLAAGLARLFGDKPAQEYRALLTRSFADRARSRYVRLNPRRVDFTELERLMRLPLLNIRRLDRGKPILYVPVRGCTIIEQADQRNHPFGSLAERTLGSARTDSIIRELPGGRRDTIPAPKFGIEGAFDPYLAGSDGFTLMQSISGIARIPVSDPENRDPEDGIDVVTTLDVDLQDVAERALRRQLAEQHAEWGCVVLMEVATGEIHAMSNLTHRPDGRLVEDFNYAIGRNMEPGSTFKLATLITLLDDAGLTLDTRVNTGDGVATVGIARVVDDHRSEGVISLRRVFEVSSNIGFAQLVHDHYASRPARFVDYVCKIGLDRPLHIQIPGSLAPLFLRPGERYWAPGETLEKMAYGYTFAITPMRTLALYNAVANGGKMISPLLVKELRSHGQTQRTFTAQTIVEQICSPSTLAFVQQSLRGVVDEGTGRVLSNPYYQVAAKTGTAQVAFGNRGYTDRSGGRRYLATMVGYFPADAPKYSCIVAIQTYHNAGSRDTYYGAGLSGPVFRAVADRVYASNTSWHRSVSEGHAPLVDSLSGLRGESARAQAQAGSVPDVVGLGLQEALYLLEQVGLRVEFSGQGKVVSQSLAPGAPAGLGRRISLTLN